MEITDKQRAELARMVREQREQLFGTKASAYQSASLNSATWDRIENGAVVRDDRLRAALVALWPWSGGDWRKVLAGRDAQDPNRRRGIALDIDKYERAIELIEAWLRDGEIHPPTEALWLWTPAQLADVLASQVRALDLALSEEMSRYHAEVLHGKRVPREAFRPSNPFITTRAIDGTDDVALLSKRRLLAEQRASPEADSTGDATDHSPGSSEAAPEQPPATVREFPARADRDGATVPEPEIIAAMEDYEGEDQIAEIEARQEFP